MIEDLAAGDARAVAAAHAAAFPESFLTRLGPRVLERFYAELATSPAGLGCVAVEDGRVVGFVAGTRSSASFFGGFYRRNAPLVAAAVLRAVAREPALGGHALSRLRHARYLLARRGRARPRRAAGAPGSGGPREGPPSPGARLLSIAVAAEARGRGVADALVDAYRARLAAEGIERVGLSVVKANARARRFYARTGWEVERETADAVYLRRSTS